MFRNKNIWCIVIILFVTTLEKSTCSLNKENSLTEYQGLQKKENVIFHEYDGYDQSRYKFRNEDLVCKECRSGTSCCGGSDWEDEGRDGNANMCSQMISESEKRIYSGEENVYLGCDIHTDCVFHCTWYLPDGTTCTIDPVDDKVQNGDRICYGGGSNIYFNGNAMEKDGDPFAVSNCNIRIEEMHDAHNGTWKCKASVGSLGVFSDTVNITTIRDNDVVVSLGVILGVSIPVAVILIVCVVLLLIWCCCPVYLALCCCCIPACRERSEASSQRADYSKADRSRNRSHYSDETQTNLPSIPQNSRRPQIRVEREATHTAPSYPSYRNANIEHHYEATDESDVNNEIPRSPQSSVFPDFASHTSPSFIQSQYSDAHPKNKIQQRGRGKQDSYYPQSFETYHDKPSNQRNNLNQPIVYTEVHSELGIVQPKTAKKISNATSLNDFNRQEPQTGRVIFDMPKNSKRTNI